MCWLRHGPNADAGQTPRAHHESGAHSGANEHERAVRIQWAGKEAIRLCWRERPPADKALRPKNLSISKLRSVFGQSFQDRGRPSSRRRRVPQAWFRSLFCESAVRNGDMLTPRRVDRRWRRPVLGLVPLMGSSQPESGVNRKSRLTSCFCWHQTPQECVETSYRREPVR